MRRAGFSEDVIVRVLGPAGAPGMTFDEAVAHNATLPRPGPRIDLDEDLSFYGDP